MCSHSDGALPMGSVAKVPRGSGFKPALCSPSQVPWVGLHLLQQEPSEVSFPPEADPETRIQKHAVYLGGDPRQHWEGYGKMKQGSQGSHSECAFEQFTAVGAWGSIPLRTMNLCRTGLRAGPSALRVRKLRYSSTNSPSAIG